MVALTIYDQRVPINQKRERIPRDNLCLTCPVTNFTTCRLRDIISEKKGLQGMDKCEIREQTEIIIEKMKAWRRGAAE